MKGLRGILRRSTSPSDFRFIRTFGEFWLFTAALSLVMLAIGAAAGILVGAKLLLASCFP